MTSRWRGDRRARWLGVGGLLASIVALSAALLVTVDRASFHFRRAALAQTQLATVLRVAMLADQRGQARARATAIADYARLVEEETAMLPARERASQAGEAGDVAELVRLANAMPDGAARRRIDALVSAVIARESREAIEEAGAMAALRGRTLRLAASLAAAAVGSAVLGGFGLLAANRQLAGEVARRTANIAAVDASRRLFFAKASHELRTPVTVMRGEAEVALAQPGGEAEALRHVIAQTQFLEHRIDELLGLAQAEDGQLRLDRAPTDLALVVANAIAAVQGFARSNEVEIDLRQPGSVPMAGDARWLEQAIVAVLDNAVKFSPIGDVVTVTVRRGAGRATLAIADRGAGVAAAALPRIFDAYYQAEAGRVRGGSGLGLALARWIVEQHGGSIAASNVEGGGGVISIVLPVSP